MNLPLIFNTLTVEKGVIEVLVIMVSDMLKVNMVECRYDRVIPVYVQTKNVELD